MCSNILWGFWYSDWTPKSIDFMKLSNTLPKGKRLMLSNEKRIYIAGRHTFQVEPAGRDCYEITFAHYSDHVISVSYFLTKYNVQ